MNWFRRRQAQAAHAHGHAPHHDEAAIRAAYERGRKEERAKHRRSPLIVLAVGAAALIGGASLVLAAKEGSFRDGGALMDAGVTTAAREAGPTLEKAAVDVRETLSSDDPS